MNNYVIGILALLLVALGGYMFPRADLSLSLGDATNFDAVGTAEIKVGTDCKEFSLYSTCSGSLFSANGGAIFSDITEVADTASSTAQIGNSGAGVGPGCIILGNSNGSTTQPVYITASGTTITATTTPRPAACANPQ